MKFSIVILCIILVSFPLISFAENVPDPKFVHLIPKNNLVISFFDASGQKIDATSINSQMFYHKVFATDGYLLRKESFKEQQLVNVYLYYWLSKKNKQKIEKYDPVGNLLSVRFYIDNKIVSQFNYRTDNDYYEKLSFNNLGRVEKKEVFVEHSLYSYTTYTYNSFGLPVEARVYKNGQVYSTYQFEYSPDGKPIYVFKSTINELKRQKQVKTYFGPKNDIVKREYLLDGQTMLVEDLFHENQPSRKFYYEYDDNRKLYRILTYVHDIKVVEYVFDNGELNEIYYYDRQGNIIREENFDQGRLFYEIYLNNQGDIVGQREYDDDEQLLWEEIERSIIHKDWYTNE